MSLGMCVVIDVSKLGVLMVAFRFHVIDQIRSHHPDSISATMFQRWPLVLC